jgi:hypothetical protein
MMDKIYSINEATVMNSVGMNTAYAGDRYVGDDGAYDRISTTEGEEALLKEYFGLGFNAIVQTLEPFVTTIDSDKGVYNISCKFPDRASSIAVSEIQGYLHPFMVSFIKSKWYMVSNKAEAETEAIVANGMLESIKALAYRRVKPTRNSN